MRLRPVFFCPWNKLVMARSSDLCRRVRRHLERHATQADPPESLVEFSLRSYVSPVVGLVRKQNDGLFRVENGGWVVCMLQLQWWKATGSGRYRTANANSSTHANSAAPAALIADLAHKTSKAGAFIHSFLRCSIYKSRIESIYIYIYRTCQHTNTNVGWHHTVLLMDGRNVIGRRSKMPHATLPPPAPVHSSMVGMDGSKQS